MKTPLPKTFAAGLGLALLSVLLGFGLGVAFGGAEDGIKNHLADSGDAALATGYQGDVAKKDAVVKKSWSYLKRAHLHGGAIGATAIGCILVLLLLCGPGRITGASAVALGAGALLYSLFWLFAGLAAPGAGGTGAAKESLAFLALPGAGLSVLGVLGTLFSVVKTGFFGPKTDAAS